MKIQKTYITEQKIFEYCKDVSRQVNQISNLLKINKNTLRADYLYPMVKKGKLIRIDGKRGFYRSVSNYKEVSIDKWKLIINSKKINNKL